MRETERRSLYTARDARNVPMHLVLSALGVRKRGSLYHCPFPGHHKNRDSHPSARIHVKTNKLHCFTSGVSWSTIDLVVELQHLSVGQAINWLGGRFGLPPAWDTLTPEQRNEKRKTQTKGYVWLRTWQEIVKSPRYAGLQPATVKVGLALLSHIPDKELSIDLSQRELLQMSGYKRFSVISKAVEELQTIGVLSVDKHGASQTKSGRWKGRPTTYRLEYLSPVFLEWRRNSGREG